jgi:hypothetical protein
MFRHRNMSGNKTQYNVKVYLHIYGAFVGVWFYARMRVFVPVELALPNSCLSLKFDLSCQMLYAPWWKYFDPVTTYCFLLTEKQYDISHASWTWRTDLYRYYTGTICMQPAIAKQSDYRRRHPLRNLSGVCVWTGPVRGMWLHPQRTVS